MDTCRSWRSWVAVIGCTAEDIEDTAAKVNRELGQMKRHRMKLMGSRKEEIWSGRFERVEGGRLSNPVDTR